jgi:hypothetical protein
MFGTNFIFGAMQIENENTCGGTGADLDSWAYAHILSQWISCSESPSLCKSNWKKKFNYLLRRVEVEVGVAVGVGGVGPRALSFAKEKRKETYRWLFNIPPPSIRRSSHHKVSWEKLDFLKSYSHHSWLQWAFVFIYLFININTYTSLRVF